MWRGLTNLAGERSVVAAGAPAKIVGGAVHGTRESAAVAGAAKLRSLGTVLGSEEQIHLADANRDALHRLAVLINDLADCVNAWLHGDLTEVLHFARQEMAPAAGAWPAAAH